jgi:4-amino-4-deoxy-L-arabinose transferase-like glycosyltransferase
MMPNTARTLPHGRAPGDAARSSPLKKCGTGYQPVKNTGKIAGATLPNGAFQRAGREVLRSPAGVSLLGALLGAFFTFSNLTIQPLHDWDEAWHAGIALDIARQGSWLAYTEDGVLSTAALKPPLYLWALAASFHVFGPTEFAARLFPALCHVAMIAMLTWACTRWFKPGVALTTAFILATHELLTYYHGGRAADIDAPLAFFLTATVLGAALGGPRGPRWWTLPAWACAVLTKGPAALQIVPVVLIWFALERAWRPLLWSLAWFAAGLLPYALYLAAREYVQPGVLAGTFGVELVGRLTSQIDGPLPVRRLIEQLVGSSAAVFWGLVLAALPLRGRFDLAGQARAADHVRSTLRLLLLWWLLPFAAFALAGTRRVWYFYPALVPSSVLAAWLLRAGLTQLETSGRRVWAGAIAVIVLGGLGLPALYRSLVVHPFDRALRDDYAGLSAAIAAQPGAPPVVLFKPYPGERFALKQGEIRYASVRSVEELAAQLRSPGDVWLLVCRAVDRVEVADVIAGLQSSALFEGTQRPVQLVRLARGQ